MILMIYAMIGYPVSSLKRLKVPTVDKKVPNIYQNKFGNVSVHHVSVVQKCFSTIMKFFQI
jgi:hypothetical protein